MNRILAGAALTLLMSGGAMAAGDDIFTVETEQAFAGTAQPGDARLQLAP